MITNNSYVDGVVHRKMREHLRRTFNTIYIINLHGDSNKQEKTAEGKPDKNVFDIKQGVAIIIAIKRNDSAELANVFIKDLWGTRDQKYEWLWQSSIQPDDFVEAEYQHEYNFFTAKPFRSGDIYNQGFCISEFFTRGLSGIKFRKDNLLITHNFTRADAIRMVNDVCELKDSEILYKYNFKETADWKIEDQRKNFINFIDSDIIRVTYRPLDFRYTYYPFDRINKIIPRGDSRRGLMKHMLTGSNIALIAGRQNKSGLINHYLVTSCPSEMKTGESTIQSYHFPLYLYPDKDELEQIRRVNFDGKLYNRLQELAEHPIHGTPDEVQVFDYIYSMLHCPAYRETYAEFLKIDFPRIPWPPSPDTFWDVSAKGAELRRLHLMEDAAIGETPYPFRGEGDGFVGKVVYAPVTEETGSVFINETQYFENVPNMAWEFWIGGYQPAQKWLKDRKGRALSFDDIRHYQKIVKILSETGRIMNTIEFPF